MIAAYYYVPNTFRTARYKNCSTSIVTAKSSSGHYIGDSSIKKLTGYHIKDTGAGQEDLIIREATNSVKTYDNIYHQGISIEKLSYSRFTNEKSVRLKHPAGFIFDISTTNFNNIIFKRKIDIVSGILQAKFRFAIWNPCDRIELLSELDNDYPIITENELVSLKKSGIKTNDLKIGHVYRYYLSTDPMESDYHRIVYIGKLGTDSKLLIPEYSAFQRRAQFDEYDYHVFIHLHYYELGSNPIGRGIDSLNVILMKNPGKRLRCEDIDQTISFSNKIRNKTTEELIEICKQRIQLEKDSKETSS